MFGIFLSPSCCRWSQGSGKFCLNHFLIGWRQIGATKIIKLMETRHTARSNCFKSVWQSICNKILWVVFKRNVFVILLRVYVRHKLFSLWLFFFGKAMSSIRIWQPLAARQNPARLAMPKELSLDLAAVSWIHCRAQLHPLSKLTVWMEDQKCSWSQTHPLSAETRGCAYRRYSMAQAVLLPSPIVMPLYYNSWVFSYRLRAPWRCGFARVLSSSSVLISSAL